MVSMASRRVLFMAILVVLAVHPTLGAIFMVGDDAGWQLGIDYSAWAQGKDFRVGDSLVFSYFPGAHNVVEVNGTELRTCKASMAVPFTTGSDVIDLLAPGEKGYICTIGTHCSFGMRLLINVSSAAEAPSAADAPLPAHSMSSSSSSSGPLKSSFVSMLAVTAAYFMIQVIAYN